MGSSALCVATYLAEVNLEADLGVIQGGTLTAEHETESFVIDVATEQADVQTAYRDSLLARFETAAQGVCHGTQTTRNDAGTVQGDLAVTEADLRSFRAGVRVVRGRIPRLTVDAAILRRDIASAHYTPAGATRDLAAIASAIETARSGLALAHSLVAGTVQPDKALSTQANADAAAAQGACNRRALIATTGRLSAPGTQMPPDPGRDLRLAGRCDQVRGRDVGGNPSRIPREQRTTRYRGMRSDQEVGQDRFAAAAGLPVAGVSLPGQERRSEWDFLDDRHGGKGYRVLLGRSGHMTTPLWERCCARPNETPTACALRSGGAGGELRL